MVDAGVIIMESAAGGEAGFHARKAEGAHTRRKSFSSNGRSGELSFSQHRETSGSNSIQNRLEVELQRIKEKLGVGHELQVVWSPNTELKLSGEVKNSIVYVYEPNGDTAVATLRHEFIDYLVTQAIEPYKSVANKLIQLINEAAYKKKEEIIERLAKIL